MIQTTFDGQLVSLVQAAPDWGSGVISTHELPWTGTAGLSNREARRPHAAALRSTLSYTALLAETELRRCVAALDAMGNEPVLCPFWPGHRRWADRATAPLQGGLKLAWTSDWATWELYTTVEPAWPAAEDNWAPVLWGFFGERGDLAKSKWYHGRLAEVALTVTEDGPAAYALQPAAGAVLAGPLPPAGYATAPRLLPILPNFQGLSDQVTLRINRTRTGFRRQQPSEFYPQATAHLQELDYQLGSRSEIATLLAFLRDHAGRGAAFWAPSHVAAAVLSADVGPADTVLNVTDTLTVNAGDYLAFLTEGGPIGRRVTAAAPTAMTLNAAAGVALPKTTLVSPLLLVRLDRSRIDLEWTHAGLADTTLRVRELPPEYAPAADETVGTTLGQLPERCYLYDCARDHGGTLLHDRFTSYERDVTYGGHTWISADLEHGVIQQGLSLEGDKVDLTSRVFALNPLVLLSSLRCEAPVKLTIMSADVAAGVASNVVILANGEVDRASLRGEVIRGRLSPGGRLQDQQAPNFLIGPGCNHSLFSVGCGLSRAAWVHTALVNGVPSSAFPHTLAIDGLARTTGPTPAYFADWFAHGWVEVGTPGTAGWQRRWILTSTNPTAGALTLTLHKAFDPLPSDNAAVTLYPGCDLTAESCRAYHASTNPRGKFDNFANYGGHPQVPASNPSLVKLSQNLGGGKK